jgi:hypothetical protein
VTTWPPYTNPIRVTSNGSGSGGTLNTVAPLHNTKLVLGNTVIDEPLLKELLQLKELMEYIIKTHPELSNLAKAAKVANRLENHGGHTDTGL